MKRLLGCTPAPTEGAALKDPAERIRDEAEALAADHDATEAAAEHHLFPGAARGFSKVAGVPWGTIIPAELVRDGRTRDGKAPAYRMKLGSHVLRGRFRIRSGRDLNEWLGGGDVY